MIKARIQSKKLFAEAKSSSGFSQRTLETLDVFISDCADKVSTTEQKFRLFNQDHSPYFHHDHPLSLQLRFKPETVSKKRVVIDKTPDFSGIVKSVSKRLKAPVASKKQTTLQLMSKRRDPLSSHKNLGQSVGLSRKSFLHLVVINQLDRKFILGVLPSERQLVAIDQHALHERVNLEILESLFLRDTPKSRNFKILIKPSLKIFYNALWKFSLSENLDCDDPIVCKDYFPEFMPC